MDARKMKKPLEGERSFSNTPIHIITLHFRRSLSSNPRPVTRHYFSPNPLFRPPFLGFLTRHSFSPNRLFQPPFVAPNFRDSVSSNPLFRPSFYFMDLVNNQIKYKNRVRLMFKKETVQAENLTTALSIPARGGSGDNDRVVENTTLSTSGVKLVAVDISQGENIVKRFLSISHENSLPVTILSGTGLISSVMLLGTTGRVSYEGRFEIKKLHGHIDRVTGSINLWLEFIMNDSSVVSGVVMGPLIAASWIEVIYVPVIIDPLNYPNLLLDDGESDDGESEDGESENGESENGESEDGESENGESRDGESENGEDN